jgi:sarcosine oxidase subunit gamma
MNSIAATLPKRLSPIHDALAHLSPTWGEHADMPVALRFAETDRATAEKLGLADLSALPRITFKGPGAEAMLRGLGLPIPQGIFDASILDDGSISARTGGSEFFLEDGIGSTRVAQALASLKATPTGVYPVHRGDACFFLSGGLVSEVMAQTCGVDFRRPAPGIPGILGTPGKLIYSRVAGVSCSILARQLGNISGLQLWMDGTYGVYLWETLLGIASELGGGPVGLSVFFASLSSR